MTAVMTTQARSLGDRLDGTLLLPEDSGYDEARTVWNAMVDRRPRAIVRCASTEDVVAAVRFARDNDLEIGVRSGGHSVVGHGVPDGGLMIDLTPMAEVRVDPERRQAWVQGGALLGALDRAAQEHGLATTAGNVSHTGVGGLTLGGGMGWLARQFGLSCDNVTAYEMVTADGAVVRATATDHPDLFWGLRGGGGNFGIVTEFEFTLHPVGTQALVVELYFPLGDAVPVIGGWRDLNADAPRQATFTAAAGVAGTAYLPAELHETPVITVGYVWVGDPDEGRALLPALRSLGKPLGERADAMSYVDLQRQDDTDMQHALRRYWKGHYFSELSEEAIDAFWRRGSADGHGPHLPAVGFQAYGGAIADVPDEDSAFSHRDAEFELVIAARWADPADDPIWINAVRAAAAALEPFATGAYVNTLGDEGAAGVRRAYSPAKLARLVALKDVYDPDNHFHLNQNIPPSGATPN